MGLCGEQDGRPFSGNTGRVSTALGICGYRGVIGGDGKEEAVGVGEAAVRVYSGRQRELSV